jgi:hypothetical protein
MLADSYRPAGHRYLHDIGRGIYWIASANWAVDPFGDAPSDGDTLSTNLTGSIIAATGF